MASQRCETHPILRKATPTRIEQQYDSIRGDLLCSKCKGLIGSGGESSFEVWGWFGQQIAKHKCPPKDEIEIVKMIDYDDLCGNCKRGIKLPNHACPSDDDDLMCTCCNDCVNKCRA